MTRRRRTVLRVAPLTGLVLVIGVPAGSWLAAQAAQQPVFKPGVDLIAVDVKIVDKKGDPIAGVRTEQFEVTVDGKPRRVVTAEFVEFTSRDRTPAAAPDVVPEPLFSSNERTTPAAARGRLVFLMTLIKR